MVAVATELELRKEPMPVRYLAKILSGWSSNSEDVMRVELETDKNASRALRMPIMDFRVHLALGERPTPELL
jgi:hypothetical protein